MNLLIREVRSHFQQIFEILETPMVVNADTL